MIQRIQTIYLLLSAILSAIFIFAPFAYFETDLHYFFDNFGIHYQENSETKTLINAYPLLILSITAIVLIMTSIFLYKKRKLQIRFSSFALLLEIGSYILIAYYVYYYADANISALVNWQISIVIPMVNTVLIYLAIRGILKDEALIRSLDRIR